MIHSMSKRTMDTDRRLTPKRQAFIHEYLVDLCGTQAAIRAGYSPRTANRTATVLLSNTVIQKRIQELMTERAERTDLKADTVIDELKTVAFVPLHEIAEKGGSWAVKVRALELLMKHLGMFEKDESQQEKDIVITVDIEGLDGPEDMEAD